jgi:hypothetical protein
MKLEQRTMQVLKNFATINPSLLFRKGNVLKTVSSQKTVMARAVVTEDFPCQFAIYDLSKFIGTLSLFNEPDVRVTDKSVFISKNDHSVTYTVADPEMIVSAPVKDIVISNPDVTFELSGETLQSVQKALAVLQLTDFTFEGDGEHICVKASGGTTHDNYSVVVGETDRTFKVSMKSEKMKLIPNTYNVIISKGIVQFSGDNIDYWIAVDA